MTTMIERAAKAAYVEFAGGAEDDQAYYEEEGIYNRKSAALHWDDGTPLNTSADRDAFRRCARAALRAMRDPTGEMIDRCHDEFANDQALVFWRTEIDAAIAEGESA